MMTCQIQLKPSLQQKETLLSTIKTVNKACNAISKTAFKTKIFKQFDLHKIVYYPIREQFKILSQLTVRAISKVVDAYKLDKKVKRSFKEMGSIKYDCRVLSFKKDFVSISTINGRLEIPFVCGIKQKEMLKFQKGETNLIYRSGKFFLHTCCEVPEEEIKEPQDFLGVDCGVNNIATDSLGNIYSGKETISVRKKYSRQRRKLQKIRTKSAKRKLSKTRRKESNFSKTKNHQISKKIVETAKRHGIGIALEDLKGIRKSTTVRKGNRYIRHSWSFYDLQQKIIYKAKLRGVLVKKIDPRNTSRECFQCGYISKSNRKTQSIFLCTSCGHTDHADKNASRVISRRATVNWSIVGSVGAVNISSSTPYKISSL